MIRLLQLASALTIAMLASVGFTVPEQTMPSRVHLAEKAAIYALPLVIMDLTREQFFANPVAADATPNRFYHIPVPGNARFQPVVRPNVDTIYSSAWLDLNTEPVVLTVPSSHGRYFMIQCMDAWTNVIADPGLRTLGNKSARFVLTGPDWRGPLPAGIKEIHSPTSMVWVLARVYYRDRLDLPAARAYQLQLDIRPLNRLNDEGFHPAGPRYTRTGASSPAMLDKLKHLGSEAFFERFLKLTVRNPPTPQDQPFVREVLDPLNLRTGEPPAQHEIDASDRLALSQGFEAMMDLLSSSTLSDLQSARTPTGWSGLNEKAAQGEYGTNYWRRAVVAVFGLGANLRADAMYLNATVDGNGDHLDGGKRYRLTFAPGKTPPVHGFWSVTLYDDRGYLVANSTHRYAIGSGSHLSYEPDGSLTIFLEPESPGFSHSANWIPTPSGRAFQLSLRAYWPKDELLEGKWMPPAVVPIDRK